MPETISVLSHNNFFDNLHDSRPCVVKLPDGSPIRIKGSHLFFGDLLGDDLLAIPPAGSISREFNLADLVPKEVGTGATVLTVSLEASVEGVVGAHTFEETTIISKAQLRAITLSVPAIEVTMTLGLDATTPEPTALPRKRSRIEARAVEFSISPLPTPDPLPAPPTHGLRIMPGDCNDTQSAKMNLAITEAGTLTKAGLAAAAAARLPPFTSFFAPRHGPAVTGVLTRAQSSILGELDSRPIDAMCTDYKNWCKLRKGRIRGYANKELVVSAGHHLESVVMCPSAFTFGLLDTTCGGTPEPVVSIGYIMLHELSHLDPVLEIIDIAYNVDNCQTLRRRKDDRPTLNADSYAWMSAYAAMMGLGKDQTCPAT
jgi:hypothetical protein